MIFKNRTIPLDSINPDDETHRITTDKDTRILAASIRDLGLINPPLLLAAGPDYTILSGFRRIAACRDLGLPDVEARIADNSSPKLECARVAITDNILQRPLNLVETSRAINMLSAHFEDPENLAKEASKLGLPQSPSVLRKIQPLCHLPPEIQRGILSGSISLSIAGELGRFDRDTSVVFAGLFDRLGIGLNKQKEIITLIEEIALRENVGLGDVLSEKGLRDILNDPDLDRARMAQKTRTYLRRRRFPTIAGAERRFEKNVKALKMGTGTKLIPPRDFEGTVYDLVLSFQDEAALEDRMATLAKILRNPALKNILDRTIPCQKP